MDDLEIFRKIAQCEDKEQMQRVIDEYNESQKLTFTNADRIRAMSDEELAKILGDKCICPPIGECAKVSGDCEKCWLEWLQQPAVEE